MKRIICCTGSWAGGVFGSPTPTDDGWPRRPTGRAAESFATSPQSS